MLLRVSYNFLNMLRSEHTVHFHFILQLQTPLQNTSSFHFHSGIVTDYCYWCSEGKSGTRCNFPRYLTYGTASSVLFLRETSQVLCESGKGFEKEAPKLYPSEESFQVALKFLSFRSTFELICKLFASTEPFVNHELKRSVEV